MELLYQKRCFLVMLGFLVAKASGQESKAICPVNEAYSDCVIPCNDCKIKGNCQFLVCNEGCDCLPGYYRDQNGVCIPEQFCPSGGVCWGQNEEYRDCKIECPRTCDNYDKEIGCTQDCVPGCYCKRGYVRDINGNCILPSQCPPQVQCLPNEEYSDCGSYCEPSCQTKGPIFCPAVCVSGCFCKRGFIRIMDPIHGVKAPCIRKHMCPFYI